MTMANYGLPTVNMEKTGRRIKMLRERAGYSVADIGRECGFTGAQAVYNWQKGISLPTVDNLVRLSFLFHVRIEDILVYDYPIVRMVG